MYRFEERTANASVTTVTKKECYCFQSELDHQVIACNRDTAIPGEIDRVTLECDGVSTAKALL